MNLPSLPLLDVLAAGRVLFPDQHEKITETAMRLRIYNLHKRHGLPLVKDGKKYLISYLALQEWMKNFGKINDRP